MSCAPANPSSDGNENTPDGAPLHGSGVPFSDSASTQPPCDWEAELRLDSLAHKLGLGPKSRASPADLGQFRVDRAHAATPVPYSQTERDRPRSRRRRAQSQAGWLAPVSWVCLALGMMAFGCGGSLVAWGLWSHRPELWTVGLPTGLVGQVLLLVGLVLQLDHLRHDANAAHAKLSEVDRQLKSTGRSRGRVSKKRPPGHPQPAFRNDPPETSVPSPRTDLARTPHESANMFESTEG